MFIGHFAVAFAAKRVAPAVSLGAFFLAAQLADLVWPNLVLLGLETVEIEPGATKVTPLNFVSYPFSHSLLALCAWAALFAVIYRLATTPGWSGPLTIAGVVLSHWVLDALSHRPDMPLVLHGGPLVGLGLWNSVAATVIVETLLFAGGVVLYVRTTQARDRIGSFGLWSLVGFLFLVSAGNLLSPPPPSAQAVAWVAQAMWLLVLWAYWVDRHRTVRSG